MPQANTPAADTETFSPKTFSKIPAEMADSLLRRGVWSFCAMEHSRIGAVSFTAPAAPFHHLSLPLERTALRFGIVSEGRRLTGRNAADTLIAVAAGAGGTTSWDATFESACFYFDNASLGLALGMEVRDETHVLRTGLALHAPDLARLLQALHADAVRGQPHGRLVGDAIFVALADRLVPRGADHRTPVPARGERPRVARALQYIHARLAEPLDIAAIADAAATSPFYLSHAFRTALGCSIWQYVLRERARLAVALMGDRGISLALAGQMAGFATYAGFIAAVRSEYGTTPRQLRRDLPRDRDSGPDNGLD